MAKTISIIGLIITTIGGIMLVISGFLGMNPGLLGQANAISPLFFLLLFGITYRAMILGIMAPCTGLAAAANDDKRRAILSLISSAVALIGGFIPLTLIDF